ncbi:MAG: hypothetical protein ABJL67_13590 [Sulfitobacter sp.]
MIQFIEDHRDDLGVEPTAPPNSLTDRDLQQARIGQVLFQVFRIFVVSLIGIACRKTGAL